MYDIVYPVKPSETNENLRYSLRSLEKFCRIYGGFNCKVWLVGYAPSWVKNVEVIPVQQTADKWVNTRRNMEAVCRCSQVSEDFILFNDDFIISSEVYEDDWDILCCCYRGTLFEQECTFAKLQASTPWRSGFHFNRQLLILAGFKNSWYGDEPLNYEFHGPIIMNREKRLKLFDRPEFSKYKEDSDNLLFQRSLYLNLYPPELPPRLIEDNKLFSDVKDYSKLTENGFFSVIDGLIGDREKAPRLNQWLNENLGQKSLFER